MPGARDIGTPDTRSLHPDPSAYLRGVYGSRWSVVAGLAPDEDGGDRLCAHHEGIAAEIVHAVRNEWAMTIGDVLLRRMLLGLSACQGLDCVDEIARRMGALLGWDPARQREEVARYRKEIEPMRRFSTATA